MTLRGTISGRIVILESPVPLADGTLVEVDVRAAEPTVGADQTPAKGHTLLDALKDVVGQAQGLPADAARNKRHYLYGHAKE